MTQPAPRRALPPEPSRGRRPFVLGIAALAVVGVLGAGVHAATRGSQAGPRAGDCPQAVRIVADPAWAGALRQAGEAWGRSLDGEQCRPVQVDEQPTAVTAREGLGDAVAWVPEDPASRGDALDERVRQADPVRLGTSPLVLVNTPEADRALRKPLRGETLRTMLTTSNTWANHGHPEWGWFKLVLPSVDGTVAGPLAFSSLMEVAGRGATPPASLNRATPEQLDLTKVQQRIVSQPELDDVTLQLDATPQDANGLTPAGPRTGVTTLALALDSAKPVHATWLDSSSGLTMAMLAPGQDATASAFATWLGSEEGGRALVSSGITTRTAGPSAEDLATVGLAAPAPVVSPVDVRRVEAGRRAHAVLARRDSVLLVLDTSGSMAKPLGPGGPRRIDVLTNYILQSFTAFPPGMSNGLITFNASNDAAQRPQVKVAIPLQPDTTKEWVAAQPTYLGTLQALPTSGGTPLYQAIATAWQHNMQHYQEGRTNRIIVVTDGRDEDARSSVSYDRLMKVLSTQQDPKRPIKVTYAAIGPDADFTTLQKIARATGQQAAQLNSPTELERKFAQVLES